MAHRHLALLALALTSTSCEEPTAPDQSPVLVSISATPVTATTGPIESGVVVTVDLTARIENRSENTIYVSRCDAWLYRSGSVPALVADQHCVTAPPRIVLAPGESAQQEYRVRGCVGGICLVPQWTGAISGRYKFSISLEVAAPGLDPFYTHADSRSFDVLHVVPVHD